MQLKDRVALITGAGRGIGRAIALGYAKEGAQLALSARTKNELEETARQAESLGAMTCVITTDITDHAQVDDMVRQALDRFSTIDILVANAGIAGPVAALKDTDTSHWTHTIQVNILGVYLCCRAVLPTMLSQGRGKIVNMSGVGGRNMSAYSVSKAGLVSLTETLSEELEGTNIQVNAMSPGSIHTRMWEETRDQAANIGDTELYETGVRVTSGRGASMERAVDLAVFLASDASGKLSGRLLQAVSDDFHSLPARIPEIMASDAYTLRRVDLDRR
jgi:3-oxoacyl-[acyl-carrier protein] reductase